MYTIVFCEAKDEGNTRRDDVSKDFRIQSRASKTRLTRADFDLVIWGGYQAGDDQLSHAATGKRWFI